MPTHFELVSEMNRRRTKGGFGIEGVTMDSPNDPNTTGYGPLTPLFNIGPGAQFVNQCRTQSNPSGWVIGSGGTLHPNPLDMGPGPGGNWPNWYWTQNQMDTQLQHAQTLRDMGYTCPSTPEQITAAAAASPFITPNQPANSPYGVTTNPTPLLKTFYDPESAAAAKAASMTPQDLARSQGMLGGPTGGGGSVNIQFNASRGGNLFYVGDTWTITITGAPNNAIVAESGVSYGPTDSNGNWSKSGTFDSSVVGAWHEKWTVANNPVGSWDFTVVASTPPPTTSGSTSGNGTQTTGSMASTVGNMASGASALGTDVTGFLSGEMITGVPNWIVLGGVVVVAALFMGSEHHGRR